MNAQLVEELRAIAAGHLRHDRDDHTLQPTALVNEAWIKMSDRSDLEFPDQHRFFALASVVMRNLLVDHARARHAAKRGGKADRRRLSLSGLALKADQSPVDVEALDAALTELATLDPRGARLVELRFFGGLSESMAAEVLGISRAAASRDWRMARAWLANALRHDGGEP